MSDFWPHKFTKDGDATQIGEEPLYDHTMKPIMSQPMVCVCCGITFIQDGKTGPPSGACPARTTKKEMRRLKNGG